MTSTEQTTLKTGNWELDPYHSAVLFTTRHLGISKVRGRFTRFETSFVVDEAGLATVSATVHLDSIDTGNEARDNHVRAADILDVENKPTLTFTAHEPLRISEDFEVTGDVTIGGITKPITLEVEWGGLQLAPATGDNHIGFSATGSIKRSDFEVATGLPNAVVSDKIVVELDIQLVEPK